MTDDGWRVEITRPAARDLKRLDAPVRERILAAFDGLKTDPATGDIKRLTGPKPPQWRLRVGDWRVRFNRDHDTRTVLILRVPPAHARVSPPNRPGSRRAAALPQRPQRQRRL